HRTLLETLRRDQRGGCPPRRRLRRSPPAGGAGYPARQGGGGPIRGPPCPLAGRSGIRRVRHRRGRRLPRPAGNRPPGTEVRAVEASLAAPSGLTERSATFVRGDAVRALADEFPAGLTGPEVVQAADAFLASSSVIQVREHRPGRPRGRMLDRSGVVD